MAYWKTDAEVTFLDDHAAATIKIDFPPAAVWAEDHERAKIRTREKVAELLKQSVLASPHTEITVNAWYSHV